MYVEQFVMNNKTVATKDKVRIPFGEDDNLNISNAKEQKSEMSTPGILHESNVMPRSTSQVGVRQTAPLFSF